MKLKKLIKLVEVQKVWLRLEDEEINFWRLCTSSYFYDCTPFT